MKVLICLSFLFSTTLWAGYSQKQLDKAMDIVDGWCMDTYCGGDFNYHSPVIDYNQESTSYEITFKAEPWSPEDYPAQLDKKYPFTASYQADWTEFTVADSTNVTIEGHELESSYWEEKGEQLVYTFSCQFQLVQPESSQEDLDEVLYQVTLDCVNAFEANL